MTIRTVYDGIENITEVQGRLDYRWAIPHAQHQQQRPLHTVDAKPKQTQPLLCQFDAHYIFKCAR